MLGQGSGRSQLSSSSDIATAQDGEQCFAISSKPGYEKGDIQRQELT